MNYILSQNTIAERSKDLELDATERKQPLACIQFLYKLTGLWFLSVAAGSVLCSIPLSAIGLPIIITVGVCSVIITYITSTIIKIWIYFIKLGWKTVKQIVYSPLTVTSYLFSKITTSIFGKSKSVHIPIEKPLSRRFSSSTIRSLDSYQSYHSRLDSPRDVDPKWRYNDLDRSYDGIIYRDSIKPDNLGKVDSIRDQSLRDVNMYRETYRDPLKDRDSTERPEGVENRLNPVFYTLSKMDKERIDICAQLYSLTTNIPMEKTGLRVGVEDGKTHGIVSLWNERGIKEPLEIGHLIGFCQVKKV
jgi:hypothetical protein